MNEKYLLFQQNKHIFPDFLLYYFREGINNFIIAYVRKQIYNNVKSKELSVIWTNTGKYI